MTALDKNSQSISEAKRKLRDHAARIAVDPRTNSVFAYAQDLFQALEAGALSLDDLDATARDVYVDLINARAERFRQQHAPNDDLAARLSDLAAQGWDAFRSAVARVRAEGRYRVFANLRRYRGEFPKARWRTEDGKTRK